MSNGTTRYPTLSIAARQNRQLQARGRSGWVYDAETLLQFLAGTGRRTRSSRRFPVRLDTGAFLSILPEEWMKHLGGYLTLSAARMSFETVTGAGIGRLACDVRTVFVEDPGQHYLIDWVVTSGLNGRGYGLLALRDVVNHFAVQTEGELVLGPTGEPHSLPVLELVPWNVSERVCYTCPGCGIRTWGRAGLNLSCEDCNKPLLRQP